MKCLFGVSILLVLVSLSCIPLVSALDTYTLILKVVDEQNIALKEANVRVTTQYGPNDYRSVYEKTNSSGIAVFTIQSIVPSAQIRVYWYSIEVASQEVELSEQVNEVTVVCAVSDLNVLAVDGNGNPLHGARVKLRWEVDIPWTLESTTDAEGLAVFPQMAYYSNYEVEVSWQDRQVHKETFDFTSTTEAYIAECDVYNLSVTVFDKRGRFIPGASVTAIRDDGRETSGETDGEGVAVLAQLAVGEYTVLASYEKVSNTTTISLTDNEETSIQLDVVFLGTYTLTIKAIDQKGRSLNKASVRVTTQYDTDDYQSVYGETNDSGIALFKNVRSAVPSAEIVIHWLGVEVAHQEVNLSSDKNNFTITCSVYDLAVKALDRENRPISGAEVTATRSDGWETSGETDGGVATLVQLAAGEYSIKVAYKSTFDTVAVNLTRNLEVSLTLDVIALDTYTLSIKAVDAHENALEGANIRVTTQYGVDDFRSMYGKTNSSGITVFKNVGSIIPSAEIWVYWRSVEVAHQQVSLDEGENSFTIVCKVSDLSVLMVDDNNRPLTGGSVELYWEMDVLHTVKCITNEEGLAIFSQMPYYGNYWVRAYWQKTKVHERTLNFTGVTAPYVAKCSVYDIAVKVTDVEEKPILEADVTITHVDLGWEISNQTYDAGIATFSQLAAGNYSIRATYQSVSNVTIISLMGNREVSLRLNVSAPPIFEIMIRVMWNDNTPVPNVDIAVCDNGKVLLSGTTDHEGVFTAMLTEGTYSIHASKDELKKVRNITIRENVTVTIVFDMPIREYTLTVEVTSEGKPIDGALIEVYHENSMVSDGKTADGIATFELKEGTYRVVVEAEGEHQERTIELREDTRISMALEGSTANALFLNILITVVALVVICLTVVGISRRLTKAYEF